MKYHEDNKQIENIFRSDVSIPNPVKNTIRDMDYTAVPKKGETKMKKLIPLLAVLVLVLGTTAAYATGLLDNLFPSDNRAVSQALANDYIQNVEMDYVQNEGIQSKVESLLMDEGNVAIVFAHVLEKSVSSFHDINLRDLKITDESGNILFDEGNAGAVTTSYDQRFASEGNTHIKQGLFLMNNAGGFPKSQKLFISFTGMTFYGNSKPVQMYEGQWSFTIDVSDKFHDVEKKEYRASASDELTVHTAVLTPTGFQLAFEIASPLDAMDLNMKLVDTNGVEYGTPNGLTVENEGTRPFIYVNFEASSFEAKEYYQLVVTDTGSDHVMTVDLLLI